MQTNDPHLSIEGAAARLGVSAAFLQKARQNGTGPAYFKVARQIRYAPSDLDAWLAAQRRRSTAEAVVAPGSQVSQ